MPFSKIKYSHSRAFAFTWSTDGVCRGLLLERTQEQIRIAAAWKATAPNATPAAIAETLAAGKQFLGSTENDIVLAASVNGGWGMTDLCLPNLSTEDLRNAIPFELKKRTPLPIEQLTWGYRILPQATASQQKKIRVFYIKTDIWRHWVKTASGLHKLDLLTVPPMLLDSLCQGVPVTLPGKYSFTYAPSENGRCILPAASPIEQPFADLLPNKSLDVKTIDQWTEDEKLSLLPAILVAFYGLSKDLSNDIKTLPPLPAEMHPQRYRIVQYISAALALLSFLFLMVGSIQGCQNKQAKMRLANRKIQQLDNRIRLLQKQLSPKLKADAQKLQSELEHFQNRAPSFPAVLTELTQIIEEPAWLGGGLEWKATVGNDFVPVTFTIREPIGTAANSMLTAELNHSPLLGDAKEIQSTRIRNDYVERKFSLNARIDMDEERPLAVKYQQDKATAAKKERQELTEQPPTQSVPQDLPAKTPAQPPQPQPADK